MKNSVNTVSRYWKHVVAAFVCALLVIAWFAYTNAPLSMGKKTYQYKVLETPSEWARGLSGRKDLATDHVFLFHFDEIGEHCMWMKDMRFAIDMVWVSPEKHVQHIEENVSPDTYPQSFCDPKKDSLYVIELSAGQVSASGAKVGDTVSF